MAVTAVGPDVAAGLQLPEVSAVSLAPVTGAEPKRVTLPR
jgi:hypothetical protein